MTKAIKCYTEHKSGKYAGCTAPHIHEVKEKEKRFEIDVDLKFTQVVYAKNKRLAKQQVKFSFDDEYNIELGDSEITAIRE